MKKNGITEYVEEVETEEDYDGYFCSISELITISILGKHMRLEECKTDPSVGIKRQSKRVLKGAIWN